MFKQLFIIILIIPFFSPLIYANELKPTELWADFNPDKGDFKEEIILEKVKDGIYFKESYISAYVLGEDVQ